MKPLAIPITNPTDGIASNLQFGMESLFQAVIRRYIQCEKTGNCHEKDGYGSVEDKWNTKNKEWSEERQWGDEENERDMEEDNDDFNGRNGKNEDDDFRRRNRPSRDVRNKINFKDDRAGKAWEAPGEIDLKIKAERGDILEARVEAIINPTRPSLSVEPLNGDEAILKVLRAKSLFDVVDVKDKDSLDKKRLLRALTKLANMVEPANNLRQKERATQAKRKIQQWQQMVNDDQKWGELLEEAENLPMEGYNRGLESSVSERIVRNAGPVLTKKLEQIAKEKGGLPVGDAFATESFQIGRYYFAKKIIHTVPPVVLQTQEDKEKLAECYKRTLNLAVELELQKLAFPEMLSPRADEDSRRDAIKSIIFRVEQTMLGFYLEKIKQIFGQ
uniref:Macro domain-containing protein n=1 Tax=Meloidogyne javanica TaxID=6303 RepID=A0A915MM27_MELJA